MSLNRNRFLVGCVVSSLVLAPAVASAKSADSLRDLIGVKGSGAERDMESRGWVLTDGHKSSSSAYTYWWNSSRKDCVMVTTRDGRYAAIADVSKSDCNQDKGGSSDSAVAAVGAMAAIAAIAAIAAHKSGHHDDGQHYSNHQQEADYERGYNDGLHNEPYHNYSRSDAYSDGYESGVDQRRSNTAYRDDHRWGSGYAASVNVSDLSGARAAGAEDELESRGFRSVDSFRSGGDGKGTIWWNSRTEQCLQVIVVNGHVDSISDIGSHRRCH
jgi:hypothetical protein